jgi:hypothetical protein
MEKFSLSLILCSFSSPSAPPPTTLRNRPWERNDAAVVVVATTTTGEYEAEQSGERVFLHFH